MDGSDLETFLTTLFHAEEASWKPSDKIPVVSKQIDLLKADLKTFLSSGDFDFDAILKESEELCEESRCLSDDMLRCKAEIEEETMAEIVKSIEDHDTISKEIRLLDYARDIVSDVSQCGRFLKELEAGRESSSFCRAVEAVRDLLEYIDLNSERFGSLDICPITKHAATLIMENLLEDVSARWYEMVSFESKRVSGRSTVVTVKLAIEGSFADGDIYNALEQCKKLEEKLSEFAQFLMKEVIHPIINHDCTVIIESNELRVQVVHKANFKPKYLDVLNNLRSIFGFLSQQLCAWEFTILRKIGRRIETEFRDTLVRDCLIDTVPNNIEDLANYNTVTEEVKDFQTYLSDIHVYPEGTFSALDYLEEMDLIFANKASQHFLDVARTIMLKDLSVTMSIGVESIPEPEDTKHTINLNQTTEEALKILEKTIPKSLFYFPRCMISKSAQELLDLVHEMMEQAVQCSNTLPKRLYNCTRMVFELYDAVVPYHHEKYLQTIPQYAALFHNNCQYLAHNLQLLGDKWAALLGAEAPPVGLLDLVQPLRDLGYRHLAAHLQFQRKQILDNIRSSELNSLCGAEGVGANAEAAVRQCLRQLALLKTVWVGVLPANVYTKVMATLTGMLVLELVHRVVSVEDVTADAATRVAAIYALALQRAPALFQSDSDIEKHVKSWPKLQELVLVLRGSLKDIEARWGEGAGPLAQHFTTDELRSLIKALFQNTQFRANLLSKIK